MNNFPYGKEGFSVFRVFDAAIAKHVCQLLRV